jgi:hypothetical protein
MSIQDSVIDMVRTTIVVDTSTREKLKQLGAKGETYDGIILRLIDEHLGKTKK